MTFLDWCLEAPKDETFIDVKVVSFPKGTMLKHFAPFKPVSYSALEWLKSLELVSEPELKDDVWYVTLKCDTRRRDEKPIETLAKG